MAQRQQVDPTWQLAAVGSLIDLSGKSLLPPKKRVLPVRAHGRGGDAVRLRSDAKRLTREARVVVTRELRALKSKDGT